MSKDIWFAEMERRMAELQDEGMGDDEAYARASDEAWGLTRDRMADMADMARMRAKERDDDLPPYRGSDPSLYQMERE